MWMLPYQYKLGDWALQLLMFENKYYLALKWLNQKWIKSIWNQFYLSNIKMKYILLLVHWIFEQLLNFILMCTLLRHRLTAQLSSRAVRFKCARTKHAVSRWALSTECVADTETVSNSKQSISNFTNNFIKKDVSTLTRHPVLSATFGFNNV